MAIADFTIAQVPIAASGAVTGGTAVAEAVVAADTVTSSAIFGGTVVETATALDTVSNSSIVSSSLLESVAALDTVTAIHLRQRWVLKFARVTPPPAGEGPGNPGILYGGVIFEEVED